MGTLLVPIVKIPAIIIKSQVVLEIDLHTVGAPPASHLFPEGVDPDRRATTSAQDLRAKEKLPAVYQIPDIVRIFHPLVYLLIWASDAVCNAHAHSPELLFAGLASPVFRSLQRRTAVFKFYLHVFLSVLVIVSPDCGKLVAWRLPLVAWRLTPDPTAN